jgi:hypothetical protein
MRYIIDLPPTLADGMNKQVREGKYKSPQEFILAAIENQLYIESQAVNEATGEADSQVAAVSVVSPSHPIRTVAPMIPPDLLSRNMNGVKTVALGALEKPKDLWGQYNRIFPVKIVARVAANLAKQYEADYVPLWELQEKAAEMARDLGKVIERKDKQLGRKRGTIISAGLPVGRDINKATMRFKNQFVGHVTGTRESGYFIEGAAPTLKFLEMVKDEKNSVRVGITPFGLKFASLSNPVIDTHDFSASFSPEEIEFLLEHIASEIPGEGKLMHLILSNVKKGVATPDELNDKVKALYPKQTDNEVVSMRAGAVSRVCELGLLKREKEGVKVTYVLTDRGEKYLKRLAKSEA